MTDINTVLTTRRGTRILLLCSLLFVVNFGLPNNDDKVLYDASSSGIHHLKTKSNKVILVPSCNSLVSMNLAIGQELQQRGHSVIMASNEDYRPRAVGKGLEFVSFGPDAITGEERKRIFQMMSQPDPLDALEQVFKIQLAWYKLYANKTLELFAKEKPDIIVCDYFSQAACDVANHLKIPYAVVHVSFLGFLGLEDHPAIPPGLDDKLLHEGAPFFARLSKLLSFPRLVLKMLPHSNNLNAVRSQFGLEPQDPDPLTFYRNRPVIVAVPLGFDYPRLLSPLTNVVGFLNYDGDYKESDKDRAVEEWLDKVPEDEIVVYVGFGTEAFPEAKEVNSIVEGLQRIPGVRVLMSLRKAVQDEFNMTSSSPAVRVPKDSQKVRIEEWFNQRMLLDHPRVKLFISHGGLQSVAEAVGAHKPLLIIPYFGDQAGNGARVVDAGIGQHLDRHTLTPQRLADTVTKMVADSHTYSRHVAALQRLHLVSKFAGEARRAAEVLEETVAVGTSHLVPISSHLNPIVNQNLDVVTFLLVLVAATLYGLFRGLRWLFFAGKKVQKSSSGQETQKKKRN